MDLLNIITNCVTKVIERVRLAHAAGRMNGLIGINKEIF